VRLPKGIFPHNIYFLTGYSEHLLSALLKTNVKIEPQTIARREDIIFRYW
jgi:hypothetical protein